MADPLPIAIFIGSIKKYIAAAATTAPKVICEYSFKIRLNINLSL
jgi:3-polyprenyl-4-hydroxybenzoate decarboxylase